MFGLRTIGCRGIDGEARSLGKKIESLIYLTFFCGGGVGGVARR